MPPLITAGHSAKRTRHEDNTNEEEQEEEEGGEAAVEPEVYQQLTEEISALCENNVQSEELLEKKQRLRSVLLCVIRTQFPGVSLHLVGSSCNGFASNTSDADFCVMFTQSRKINQRNEALRYFMALGHQFGVLLMYVSWCWNTHYVQGFRYFLPTSVPEMRPTLKTGDIIYKINWKLFRESFRGVSHHESFHEKKSWSFLDIFCLRMAQ